MITQHRFYGYTILASDVFVERRQFRFPRSKKRRIRAKWAKRPGNWRAVPSMSMYFDEKRNTFYCHPDAWAKVEQVIEQLRSPVPTPFGDDARVFMDSFAGKPLPSIEKIKRQAALIRNMMSQQVELEPPSPDALGGVLHRHGEMMKDMMALTFARPKIDPPEGEAEIVVPIRPLPSHLFSGAACRHCGGTRSYLNATCKYCRGTGLDPKGIVKIES